MILRSALACAMFLIAPLSHAQNYDAFCPGGAQIATGGSGGNYFAIGGDLATIGAEKGIGFTPMETQGSVENGGHVLRTRCTPMGIVQQDYLQYLKQNPQDGATPGEFGTIASRMVAVMPLYLEFVHILARNEIKDFSDLDGGTISIGPPNSGSNLTASLLLPEWGLKANVETLPTDRALQDLKDNFIDAMIFVTGHWSTFSEIDPAAGLHLLSPPPPAPGSVYESVTLPASKYPGILTTDLQTLGVRATLMTFQWGNDTYNRASCQRVTEAVRLIEANFDCLKAKGNQNWERVDQTAMPGGWAKSPCATAGEGAPDMRYRAASYCGGLPAPSGATQGAQTGTASAECQQRCASYTAKQACMIRCMQSSP